MTIKAGIVADSISHDGVRLTTLQLRYPRFIHAEFMTHRMFSRNASSSRAVPVKRLIQDVLDDTAMPIHWGRNQPGMQAREECNEEVIVGFGTDEVIYGDRVDAWNMARDQAIEMAREFDRAGYHKQIVNRLLEPFSHINVVVTATDWDNFFELRLHPDAQPEIHELARVMKQAMDVSTPALLDYDQWHLPYVTEEDRAELHLPHELIMLSVARCARVSYLTHDGAKPDIDKDVELYQRLMGSEPRHASPAEHQAVPDFYDRKSRSWKCQRLHGNFHGWIQYRKTLESLVY